MGVYTFTYSSLYDYMYDFVCLCVCVCVCMCVIIGHEYLITCMHTHRRILLSLSLSLARAHSLVLSLSLSLSHTHSEPPAPTQLVSHKHRPGSNGFNSSRLAELEEALAEPRERRDAAGAARSRRLLISRVFELFASPDAGTHRRRYALLLYLFAVCSLLHALPHVMHHYARGFRSLPAR